jgi:hypothetical protein
MQRSLKHLWPENLTNIAYQYTLQNQGAAYIHDLTKVIDFVASRATNSSW